MDIKLLRSFVQLSDAGHYGKAAAKLFITQSTLSKQIHALEADIGGPLFERGRHGAKLTRVGQIFRQEAALLLRLNDDITIRMHRATAGLTGSLDVGFGISTLTTAPHIIARFRAMTPDCQITLNDIPSAEQHQRLLDGRLDIGFCRAPAAGRELSFMHVIEEQLALTLPVDMAHLASVPLPILNDLGFVALSPGRGLGLAAQISAWCSVAQFSPRLIQQADDILTVHAVVAAGLGAAFLPLRGIEALGGRTHHAPLIGPGSRWPVGLCWRISETNPLVLRFVDHVATFVAGRTANLEQQ